MPNALLLLSGSELTRGETRDLNGPFLAAELTVLGVRVDEVVLLPDDPALLAQALRGAIARADLVLFSGGLGPTADDHTVRVVAEVFGRQVIRHPEAESRMRDRAAARGLTPDRIPANYWKQADTVAGAEVLLNPVGLAPGMLLDTARGFLAVFPGVPRELTAMFRELVVPAIRKRFSLTPPRILRAKVLGQGESWVEARIQKLGIDFARLEYGISAKPGEVLVKFTAHDERTHADLDHVRELLAAEFGEDIVIFPEGILDASGAPIETEHALLVHRLLLQAGTTLATAESCTGGLIAKSLTDHAGSSAYFLGAVVAYSNGVKEEALGVPRDLLARHGAVSAEVCSALARGVCQRFSARFGLAVTGIAGPTGGTPEKPVGLVYIGLAEEGPAGADPALEVERHVLPGNREMVRAQAAVRALDLLRRRLGTPGKA